MAGTLNAGSIIYEVDMDTAKLLAARREVDAALNGMGGSLNRLEGSVNRTERSVASMQKTMSGLSGVAKAVVSALSIQQVAHYGNEWVNVNNKLANSVRASEQLVDVTQRVFDISQNTMSSLTATATLYGRLERATRSAGTSTKDLITLTETINKGLAVSGATTEEASSTMTQLSQALASGVLRGEEFNSISENGSRLAVALADSLGVTIGQLRKMAAEGKLTTEVVVNGLLKQSAPIAKEFANTVTTMGQAFTIATNNITKFIGESTTVQSTINAFNSSVITLSQNLETIGAAISVMAAIMGGRFVGMLTAATAAQFKMKLARIADAKAAKASADASALDAQAKLNGARAEKAGAISSLNLAEAKLAQAKAANYSTVTAQAELLQEEANAAADLQSVKSSLQLASAELAVSKARLSSAQTSALEVTSEMEIAAARVNSIRVNIAQLESEKALEAQRLRAQISEKGRIMTSTRMAEVQRSLAVLNQSLAKAEQESAAATQVAVVNKANAIAAAETKVTAARQQLLATTNAITAAQLRYNQSQAASQLSGAQAQQAARVAALAAAEKSLSAARLQAATATDNYNRSLAANTIAQQSAAAATASASASMTLLRGGLSLIGGPAGAAIIAAAAIYYFFQKAQQAKQEAVDFADKLEGLLGKMKEMSATQISAEIAKASQAMRTQAEVIDDQRSKVDGLIGVIANYKRSMRIYGESARQIEKVRDAQESLAIEQAKLEDLENRYSRTKSAVNLLQAQQNGALKQGIELLKRDGEAAGVASGLMNQFGTAIDFASKAKQKFNSTSLEIPRSADADAFNKDLAEQNVLLAITDKRLRAVTRARMEATAKGGNVNQVNSAGELAAQQYDLQEAEKSRANATKETTKTESQAEQAEKRRQKSLQDLTEQAAVAELQLRGLNREAAQLAAVQDLGAGATAKQIEQASQQAGQIFDIQQRAADKKAALEQDSLANASRQRDLDLAQVQRQLAAGDISFEQSQKRRADIAASYSEQIAQANAKSAVSPQQAAAATVDPVQALANENAQKLALIQQFENQKVLTEQQSLALRNSLNLQYDQQRTAAMWTMWRNQSVGNEAVAASFDSIAGNASNAFTGMVTGSMSAEEAMQSLASNAINSLINSFVQMGVEWVKSAVTGAAAQTTAVATTTAASVAGTATTTAASTTAAGVTLAAWTPAALVASIGSFGGAAAIGLAALVGVMALSGSLAGKRKNGGPVSAGSMYQVGEGGMPEIYRASNGSQYMIPGDNGSVISNKDLRNGSGGASGGGVVINIQNYTSATVDAQANNTGGGITVDVIIADLDQGGPIRQAITRNTTATARATE